MIPLQGKSTPLMRLNSRGYVAAALHEVRQGYLSRKTEYDLLSSMGLYLAYCRCRLLCAWSTLR